MTNTVSQPTSLSDRRARRREAIIITAARRFAGDGYADCEMESVASELSIAKGTLYLYFKSKEELFFACVDHGMRELQTIVQAAGEIPGEPFERISAAIRAYLLFFEQHPEQVELLIQERACFHHRQTPTYFTYRDESRDRWRSVWTGLLENGSIRPGLMVDQILDFVGNLVYGTMFTNHFLSRSAEEQHTVIMDIFYRGILNEGRSLKHNRKRSEGLRR